MRRRLTELLACPSCGGALELETVTVEGDWIESGHLNCAACAHSYPIEKGVARLVPIHELAEVAQELQCCSGQRQPQAEEAQFLESTLLDYKAWKGKLVLDAACGSGQASLCAVRLGGESVAVERSCEIFSLAQAARANPKLHPVQGDLSRLPLRRDAFDMVLALGTIAGTGPRYATFQRLARVTRKGGRLCLLARLGASERRDLAQLFGGGGRRLWLATRARALWRRVLCHMPEFFKGPLAATLAACGALPLVRLAGFSAAKKFGERREQNRAALCADYEDFMSAAEILAWLRDGGFSVEKARTGPLALQATILARKG